MPSHVILLKIFVGSPGDLREARRELREAVDRMNSAIALPQGICAQVVGWENVSAGVGDPQKRINDALRECDLLVVLMGRRLGTPTPAAPSGTVEEFQLAYELYKEGNLDDIKLYVAEKLMVDAQNQSATEQATKLDAWRQQIERDRIVYFSKYKSLRDLSEKLNHDLQDWLRSWTDIVHSAMPRLGVPNATTDMENTFKFAPIREKAEVRLRSWSSRDQGVPAKAPLLEELAFNCYRGMPAELSYPLRAWAGGDAEASWLADPPLFPYELVPESLWKTYPDGRRSKRLWLGGSSPKVWLTTNFPQEVLFANDRGFTFARPELLWYFVACKLLKEIKADNSEPMTHREFTNEIHQFLSTMIRKDPDATGSLRRWLLSADRPAIVRNFAAFELGMSQDKGAIDDLLTCLQHDPGQNVRVYAAQALGMIKDRQVVPRLLKLVRTLDDDRVKPYLYQAILYIKNVIANPYW